MHIGLIGGDRTRGDRRLLPDAHAQLRGSRSALELNIVNADLVEMTRNLEAERADEQACAFAIHIDRLR